MPQCEPMPNFPKPKFHGEINTEKKDFKEDAYRFGRSMVVVDGIEEEFQE